MAFLIIKRLRLPKRSLVILLIASMSLSINFMFLGCEDDNSEVIAVVNGEEITREQKKEEYQRVKKIYESQGADIKEMENKFKNQIINGLVEKKILTQEAEKKGLEVKESDIEKEIDLIKNEIGGVEELEKKLELYGMTEEILNKEIKFQLLITNLKYQLIGTDEIVVSEEELNKRYEERKKRHREKQKMIQTELAEDFGDEIQNEKDFNSDAYEGFEVIKPELEKMLFKEKKLQLFDEIIERLKEKSEIEILK